MRWTVHGERTLYDSPWVRLALVDVEPPGAVRYEHHVVRVPMEAAGVVVRNDAGDVLMLYRHRFITGTWGWELPAGAVEFGEDPAAAAAREVLEETGWRPGPLSPLLAFYPTIGLADQLFRIYCADGATREGDPDGRETDRVEWIPQTELRQLLRSGAISCGLTLASLSYMLAIGA